MTEQQQRLTIRAELARRMYPDGVIEPSFVGDGVDIRVYDKPNETRTWYNFDPFTNAADKDALVEWLAADDARWFTFIRHLIKLVNWPQSASKAITDPTFAKIVSEVRYLMTAPRETITLAAARALGIQEAEDE